MDELSGLIISAYAMLSIVIFIIYVIWIKTRSSREKEALPTPTKAAPETMPSPETPVTNKVTTIVAAIAAYLSRTLVTMPISPHGMWTFAGRMESISSYGKEPIMNQKFYTPLKTPSLHGTWTVAGRIKSVRKWMVND
ncbi:MAG: OadG family protein [Candidatus Bathyarchaeota archaeon]